MELKVNVRHGPKADLAEPTSDVRFRG